MLFFSENSLNPLTLAVFFQVLFFKCLEKIPTCIFLASYWSQLTKVEEFIGHFKVTCWTTRFREEIFLLLQPRTSANQRAVQMLCRACAVLVRRQSCLAGITVFQHSNLIPEITGSILSSFSGKTPPEAAVGLLFNSSHVQIYFGMSQ